MNNLITLCILASICLSPLQGHSKNLQLTLATGEWQPYTSKEMTNYGIFTEIIHLIIDTPHQVSIDYMKLYSYY